MDSSPGNKRSNRIFSRFTSPCAKNLGLNGCMMRMQTKLDTSIKCAYICSRHEMSNIMKTKSTLCKVRLVDLYLRLQHDHKRPRLCHCKPFISMQNHYNLVYREEEREMMPRSRCRNFSPLLHIYANHCILSAGQSPLARGILARPAQEKTERSETDWYDILHDLGSWHSQRSTQFISSYATKEADVMNVIAKRVEEIASKRSVIMAQVALAWVMSKDRMFSCSSFRKFPAELAVCTRSSRGGSHCRHQLFGEVARHHQYVPVLLHCVNNC
jgi:hypothetical protein